MAEKTLKLYKASATDFNEKVRFPEVGTGEFGLEIGDFTFDAKRMGGAPTIQCTIMYHRCLDDEWSDLVFTEFRGERYYLKQTPSSSKDNKDARWKHEAEFVAERVVLDNIYFFDVVTQDEIEGGSAPVSNSTEFTFFGTISEFVGRLNASLLFLGFRDKYEVKINAEYKKKNEKEKFTTGKLVAFTDKFFSQALQEIYNVYELYYYFKREGDKTIIYIADYESKIDENLEYGRFKSLMSVKKDNANYKPINRICGRGSEDNIPYYYPNPSNNGVVEPIIQGQYELKPYIDNEDLFYKKLGEWNIFEVSSKSSSDPTADNTEFTHDANSELTGSFFGGDWNSFQWVFTTWADTTINFKLTRKFTLKTGSYKIYAHASLLKIKENTLGEKTHRDSGDLYINGTDKVEMPYEVKLNTDTEFTLIYSFPIVFSSGNSYSVTGYGIQGSLIINPIQYDEYIVKKDNTVIYEGKYPTNEVKNYGISWSGRESTPSFYIEKKIIRWYLPQKKLQTKVYINSIKDEVINRKQPQRFYPAINDYPFEYIEGETEINEAIGEYIDNGFVHNDNYKGDDGNYYNFENPYFGNNPYEHIIDFPDIKPSIEGMENDEGLRIDMFSEFAYDADDNNFEKEYSESGNDGGDSGTLKREHPYFFGKLRKMPFNLFDHAIENGEMTVAMTNGKLGSCKFVIHVGEKTQKNLVQVDSDGNLERDEHGNVLCGRQIYVDDEWKWQKTQDPQDQQNDTRNNEVWVALAKDTETFPSVMPYAKDGEFEAYQPKASDLEKNNGDTFVLLNIHLPQAYIDEAEKKLTKETLKYMAEFNKERFNFAIDFSRIFLAENPTILEQLNENAKITVVYNEKPYEMYISGYSYKMSANSALPEIKVDLADTLTAQQGVLQNVISEVKASLLKK